MAYFVCKGFECSQTEYGALAGAQPALLPGMQRRAVSAHQACDIRTDDDCLQLVFKGAQHGVVEERSALYDNVFSQFLCAGTADHLVQRILDHGDRKTGRDIGYLRAVLLRLLDRGIHEHRAAGTQVNRLACSQTQLGEFSDTIAKRIGKCLQE